MTAETKAAATAELALALNDPINAAVAKALNHWGEHLPLEVVSELAAQVGARIPLLRNRQRRLTRLMVSAGQPPQPLFVAGELVALRPCRAVTGHVVSLTRHHVQIRLLGDNGWLSVPIADVLRLEPKPFIEPAHVARERSAPRPARRARACSTTT